MTTTTEERELGRVKNPKVRRSEVYTDFVHLPAGEVKPLLWVGNAVSNDINRPALNCIYVRDGFAYGTNGHLLHRLKLDEHTELSEGAWVVAPASRGMHFAYKIRYELQFPNCEIVLGFHEKGQRRHKDWEMFGFNRFVAAANRMLPDDGSCFDTNYLKLTWDWDQSKASKDPNSSGVINEMHLSKNGDSLICDTWEGRGLSLLMVISPMKS